MNPKMYDNKPQFPGGSDPRTATNEFRALLAASGKSQGIITQFATLLLWAEKTGRKIGMNCDISQARIGGLEHYVWPDEAEQVARKFTYGGMFGRTVRDINQGLVPVTPLEYLTRWANHNDLFSPITKISGVLEAAKDGPAILLEQTLLFGDLPSLAVIQEFLIKKLKAEKPQPPNPPQAATFSFNIQHSKFPMPHLSNRLYARLPR